MSISAPPKKATKLTRRQLYVLVWKTPLTHLGKRFGVSGNTLAKICRQLDVPYPPQGHWTRVALGKKTTKIALPAAGPDIACDVVPYPTPPGLSPAIPPESQAEIEQLRKGEASILVPSRLAKPPLIAHWIAAKEAELENARLERDPWRRKMYPPQPFDSKETRRHRILDTLFKELEQRGAKIVENDRRELFAEMLGEQIEFQLRGKLQQVQRPLTDDEKRWGLNGDRGYKQELESTSYLIFSIKNYMGDGRLRSNWLETATKPMEEMLAEIVAGFLAAAPFLAERSRQRNEERRSDEEAARRRALREEREKIVQARLRKLLGVAKAWHDVQLARLFLSKLRTVPSNPMKKVAGKTTAQWAHWMNAHLDEVDPLQQGAIAIFSEVADVDA